MTATSNLVDVFNGLLRGELAATETYQQAIAKFDGTPGAAQLRALHEEHRDAANTLREHVHELGGTPDQGSGAWGSFAKLVEGTAKAFGQNAALKALLEGEKRGLADYETAAESNELMPKCKTLIRKLQVKTEAHLGVLDRMMDA